MPRLDSSSSLVQAGEGSQTHDQKLALGLLARQKIIFENFLSSATVCLRLMRETRILY